MGTKFNNATNSGSRQLTVDCEPLAECERDAALRFLGRRPLHTVIMAGWIGDYGVVHPHHRGTFFRTSDERGNINGVALIGRHTCFETASEKSVAAFAQQAGFNSDIKLVFGQSEDVRDFWHHYAWSVRSKKEKTAFLFEIRRAQPADVDIELRTALPSDLEMVVAAHASMAKAEAGDDPLKVDPDGFRARCAERISKGNTWVWVDNGTLIFKTDVISRTPSAVYIEGLWVDPEHRDRKIASRSLAAFSRRVLDGSNAICGFVCAEDLKAQSVYRRAGFNIVDRYSKYYV